MTKQKELSHTRKIGKVTYKQVQWHHSKNNARASLPGWEDSYPEYSFRILPASSSAPSQYGRRGYGIFISETKMKRRRKTKRSSRK